MYSGIKTSKIVFPKMSEVSLWLFNSILISTFSFLVIVDKLSLSKTKFSFVTVSFNFVSEIASPISTKSCT